MTKPTTSAARSVQVAQGGVAIIIEVSGNARVTVQLGPPQKARPPKRSKASRA
jgi:hypothetical protein